MLIVSSSLSLHAITEQFNMSRQALSRHISTLESSGILKTQKQGRETIFTLDMSPLKEVIDLANHYQAFWENKLNNLDQLIEQKKNA